MVSCPKCGFEQPGGADCARCGVNFLRFREVSARRAAARPAEPAPAPPTPPRAGPPARRTTVRDVCTGLAQLFKAGLGPAVCFRTLAETSTGAVRRELLAVAGRLEAGDSLADAVRFAPRLFRPADAVVLSAFEEVGDSGGGFAAIAARAEGAIEVRRQLVRQSAYPLIVLVAHFVISPLPRLVLGGLESYLVEVLGNLGLLAAAAVVVVWVAPAMLRAGLGQRLKRLAWRLPWPASIWVAHSRAVFHRTLGRNLGAGLELYRAVRSAAASTSDPVACERAEQILPAIGAEGLSQPAARAGLVARPELMLIVSAERAGRLDETLGRIADRYEEQRRRGLRWLMNGLGALLTLAVIALVALSIVETYQNTLGGADQLLKGLDGAEGLDLDDLRREVPILDLPE